MPELLQCWKCGATLVAVILPMSRREECPNCSADQHVCRLCRFYDTAVADACREDRAEQVSDKERANFCDYFAPQEGAFKALSHAGDARAQLAALFGDEPSSGDNTLPASGSDAIDELRKLFDDK